MGTEKLNRHISKFTIQVEKARQGAIGMEVASPEFRTWLMLRLRLDGMLEANRILNEPEED